MSNVSLPRIQTSGVFFDIIESLMYINKSVFVDDLKVASCPLKGRFTAPSEEAQSEAFSRLVMVVTYKLRCTETGEHLFTIQLTVSDSPTDIGHLYSPDGTCLFTSNLHSNDNSTSLITRQICTVINDKDFQPVYIRSAAEELL